MKKEDYLSIAFILGECLVFCVLVFSFIWQKNQTFFLYETQEPEKKYIKWVDFTVSYEALCSAYEWDVKTHGTEHEVHWVELLAYTAAKTGI